MKPKARLVKHFIFKTVVRTGLLEICKEKWEWREVKKKKKKKKKKKTVRPQNFPSHP